MNEFVIYQGANTLGQYFMVYGRAGGATTDVRTEIFNFNTPQNVQTTTLN